MSRNPKFANTEKNEILDDAPELDFKNANPRATARLRTELNSKLAKLDLDNHEPHLQSPYVGDEWARDFIYSRDVPVKEPTGPGRVMQQTRDWVGRKAHYVQVEDKMKADAMGTTSNQSDVSAGRSRHSLMGKKEGLTPNAFLDAVNASLIAAELDRRRDTSISQCPSPWLEDWYDEGESTSFQVYGGLVAPGRLRSLAKHNSHGGHAGGTPQSNSADTDKRGQPSLSPPSTSAAKRTQITRWADSRGYLGRSDDDDGPPEPQRRRLASPSEETRKFACPYQKRCPSQNWLCGLPHGKRTHCGWSTVSRVKQHLLRSHGKSYHCSNCWRAFSSKLDEGKCSGNRCQSRLQPDKHWLTDEQVTRLETEKIPNSPSGWFRLMAMIFPDVQEGHYTPYYSMWNQVPVSSDPRLLQNTETELAWASSLALITMPSFAEHDTSATSGHVSSGALVQSLTVPDVSDLEALQWTPFETTIPDMLDESYLDMGTMQSTPDEPPSNATNTSSDDAPAGMAYARSNDTEATSATGPTPPGYPSCSCASGGSCGHCRLKKRTARLEAENESLRATIERAQTLVSRHDEVLQDVHDSRRLPDAVMEELWVCQDELRKALQGGAQI